MSNSIIFNQPSIFHKSAKRIKKKEKNRINFFSFRSPNIFTSTRLIWHKVNDSLHYKFNTLVYLTLIQSNFSPNHRCFNYQSRVLNSIEITVCETWTPRFTYSCFDFQNCERSKETRVPRSHGQIESNIRPVTMATPSSHSTLQITFHSPFSLSFHPFSFNRNHQPPPLCLYKRSLFVLLEFIDQLDESRYIFAKHI